MTTNPIPTMAITDRCSPNIKTPASTTPTVPTPAQIA